MKVITPGINSKMRNKDETMRVTCKRCKTQLEIVAGDVKREIPLLIPTYYFKCPFCYEHTKVKTKDMTENFKYWVQWHNVSFD